MNYGYIGQANSKNVIEHKRPMESLVERAFDCLVNPMKLYVKYLHKGTRDEIGALEIKYRPSPNVGANRSAGSKGTNVDNWKNKVERSK